MAIEGKLIGKLTEHDIDSILAIGEVSDVSEGVLMLHKWAIPHWDWVDSTWPGSVKASLKTIEYIIGRLNKVCIKNGKAEIAMCWLDFGFSVDSSLDDWNVIIDFSKIRYKE